MSDAEHRDYYRRTALRCLAGFAFWVMGVMLAAFMVTGAIFHPAGKTAMPFSLALGLAGGLALAVRIFQLSRRNIKNSLERDPGGK